MHCPGCLSYVASHDCHMTTPQERDVEVKRAVSREDMRKVDSPRGHSGGGQGGNYGGGRDPYAGGRGDGYYPGYGRGGGGVNYGAAMGGERVQSTVCSDVSLVRHLSSPIRLLPPLPWRQWYRLC